MCDYLKLVPTPKLIGIAADHGCHTTHLDPERVDDHLSWSQRHGGSGESRNPAFVLLGWHQGAVGKASARSSEVLYRLAEPILSLTLPQERIGTIGNVVFPTGIYRRDDLGQPSRFDVYYGMTDNRIGMARLDLPDSLPSGGVSAEPKGKV